MFERQEASTNTSTLHHHLNIFNQSFCSNWTENFEVFYLADFNNSSNGHKCFPLVSFHSQSNLRRKRIRHILFKFGRREQLKRKKYEYDFLTHFREVSLRQMKRISSHNTRIIQEKKSYTTFYQCTTKSRIFALFLHNVQRQLWEILPSILLGIIFNKFCTWFKKLVG